jgi:hypothetical protein
MCFETPFLIIDGDCSAEAPSSTQVINRLPGISLRRAANIANEEFVTGVNMIRELEADAIEQVTFDILDKVADSYQFKSVVASEDIGRRTSTKETASAEVGVELTRSKLKGKGMLMQVPEITIIVDTDMTVDLNINEDGTVRTVSVDLNKDTENVVIIEAEALRLLRITYTPVGDVFSTYTTSNFYTSDGLCSAFNDFCCGNCLHIKSIENDGSNYIQSTKFNGMILTASCRASECEILRHFKREIAPAVRLQTAIKMMHELLVSDRSNPIVANGRDSARQLLAIWEGGEDPVTGFAIKGQYPKRIAQIAKMMTIYIEENHSASFDCSKLRIVETQM